MSSIVRSRVEGLSADAAVHTKHYDDNRPLIGLIE